jgi:hypothetical protein
MILNENIGQIFPLVALILDLKCGKNFGFSLSEHYE